MPLHLLCLPHQKHTHTPPPHPLHHGRMPRGRWRHHTVLLPQWPHRLGIDCCKAITIITRDYWPAMLSSLSFTAEERNVLQGYYDGSGHDTTPAAPPLHAPSPSTVQDFTSST
uniref:Prolamin-like domain-containing protein n=1 Tax=Kalanchoe fedtschenkoi TaxID=63787 RepID=A0A7N0VDB7_KALFE